MGYSQPIYADEAKKIGVLFLPDTLPQNVEIDRQQWILITIHLFGRKLKN